MKKKYLSMDSRTGYREGEIAELTMNELNSLPFNVYMKQLDKDRAEVLLEDQNEKQAKEALRKKLRGLGLSKNRTAAVIEKYPREDFLVEKANAVGIDPLTDAFIKKHFGKDLVKKKKFEKKSKKINKKIE